MAIQYTTIEEDDLIADSRIVIINNNQRARSNNAEETSFPTTELQIGMQCYIESENKTYQLTGLGPAVWKEVFDGNKTNIQADDANAYADALEDGLDGAVTTVINKNLIPNITVLSDESGKIEAIDAPTNEPEEGEEQKGEFIMSSYAVTRLAGLKSDLQNQIDGKLNWTSKSEDSKKINGANKTVSIGGPSGGMNGDFWFQI